MPGQRISNAMLGERVGVLMSGYNVRNVMSGVESNVMLRMKSLMLCLG